MSETKKTLDDKELEEANGGFPLFTRITHWENLNCPDTGLYKCSFCGGTDFYVVGGGNWKILQKQKDGEPIDLACSNCGKKLGD